VLSLRGLLPQLGKVELTVEGAGALRVAGSVQPDSPAIADGLEKGIRAGLQELDAQAEKRRAVTERALGELKGSVGKDPEAPSRLRGAVAGATVDMVLDPTGDYAALRKSVQVARQGQTVTAEVTVPEGQVRRLVRFDGGMTTVAMVGILSAIAIPNFVKYQCRSRTAEGEAALQAGWAAVARYRAAKGAFPARLDQLDLPTRGRYALCMRSGCTPPASPRVATACGEALAGMAGGPGAPALCAATDLFGDGKPDVWVIGAAGEPMHVRSACD
jgi:type II secretory pathway pseudopilin PulG